MKHYKRGFLNKDEGLATFEHSVGVYGMSTEDCRGVSASLCLSDCSRRIWLEFDMNSGADADTRLEKLDTLISEMEDFRSKLVQAISIAFTPGEQK